MPDFTNDGSMYDPYQPWEDGLPPIRDAFTYNPAIRNRLYDYFSLALGSMEVLRRSTLRRAHFITAPDDQNTPIAAYETYEQQFRLIPDTYIWGISCVEFSGPGSRDVPGYVQTSASDFLIQITEVCTGLRLFYEYVTGKGFQFYTQPSQKKGIAFPHLLRQPRLIISPGDITVAISNRLSTPLYCQLILFTAEPVIREALGPGNFAAAVNGRT